MEDCVTEAMFTSFRYIYETEFSVERLKQLKEEGVKLLPVLKSDCTIRAIYNLKKKKSILLIDAVLMAEVRVSV